MVFSEFLNEEAICRYVLQACRKRCMQHFFQSWFYSSWWNKSLRVEWCTLLVAGVALVKLLKRDDLIRKYIERFWECWTKCLHIASLCYERPVIFLLNVGSCSRCLCSFQILIVLCQHLQLFVTLTLSKWCLLMLWRK